ncbi:MAG: ABC transporter permease [Terriglobales bacterium]
MNASLAAWARAGWRAIRRSPGLSAVAILTLALGIGANTAVFSVVDAVLLRPLPYAQPHGLVAIRESLLPQFPIMSVSLPDYYDWAQQSKTLRLAAFRGAGLLNLTVPGVAPQALQAGQVTANLFPVLGVRPQLGRGFTAREDQPGAPRVVMLSDALWRQRFGANPRILGQAVTLNGNPYSVIGVMPPGFDFPGKIQAWVSLGAQRGTHALAQRDNHPGIVGIGRLRPGYGLAQSRAEMDAIARRLDLAYPKTNTGEGVRVTPYLEFSVHGAGAALWALLAAVGLVLLIACANLANLLLARAAARRQEFAVRAALGASRAQIWSQVLGESLTLALLGGAAGLGLAALGIHLAPPLLPTDLPRVRQLGLDWRVLLFTFAIALLCGVLFGLAPAWRHGDSRVQEVLKEGGRGGQEARGGRRLRDALVVGEVALALVLLAGAGLLLRSFLAVLNTSPGFDPRQELLFDLSLPASQYPKDAQRAAFLREALTRLRRVPGVTAAGLATPMPFGGSDWETSYQIIGRPKFPPGQSPSTNCATVSSGFFRALRIPLLRGRGFDDDDTARSQPVVMISRGFAKKYWGGAARAIGQPIQVNGHKVTIVGVFPRIKTEGLTGDTEMDKLPEAMLPYQQDPPNDSTLVLRAAPGLNPMALAAPAARVVQSLDPNLPISNVHTMDGRVAASVAPRQLALILVLAFAALALILAAVGIYGVMSYAVERTTHDLGLRMALGARRRDIVGLVLRRGLLLAGAGALAGLVLAFALGRTMAGFLFGVHADNPVVMILVAVLLLAVAALACYLPARRASRVDPMEALRWE